MKNQTKAFFSQGVQALVSTYKAVVENSAFILPLRMKIVQKQWS